MRWSKERIRHLEHKAVELTRTEQQNRKQISKSEVKEPVGQVSSRIALTLLGSQKEKREKGEQKT